MQLATFDSTTICRVSAEQIGPQQELGEALDREVNLLAASIRQVGLLQPLLAWCSAGHYFIIDGRKRLAAWQHLYGPHAPLSVRLITSAGATPLFLKSLRLQCNSHRWQPLVTHDVVALAAEIDDPQFEQLLPAIAQALGQQHIGGITDLLRQLARLPNALTDTLASKRLPLQALTHFGSLADDTIALIAQHHDQWRLSSSQWRQFLTHASESLQRGVAPDTLNNLCTKHQHGATLMAAVEQMRHPDRTRFCDVVEQDWRHLKLPRSVNLELNPSREAAKRLTLTFDTLAGLEEVIDTLAQRIDDPDFRGFIENL